MRRLEVLLTLCGVGLLVLAVVLLVSHGRVAECRELVVGYCQETGFAYEAGGKLALLLAFGVFLTAALLGIFRRPGDGQR